MSVPRIRVDGFNKNFEKKIFGEIVRSESTRMYIKSVVSDLGKYEVIQQGDIPILGYSDDRPFEKYKSVILFGDHTLSLYRPKAPFLLATDGIKILQSTILKRDYLYYLTQNYIPKSQGYKRHFSLLKQVFVNYSRDSSEQSAIGSLFRTLDDLLASYKDNLANYQSFKETMLFKMFPKAGQTVPEIRLDGFDGEWEKSKLKDVAHRVQGNDGRMDLPTLTISASGGWMDQIDRFSANIAGKEQKNYTLLKKGELSYNHGNSKLAKYGVVFELQEYEEALVPKVYHSFRVNQLADSKFIEIMFSTKIPDRELGKLISSGARMDGLLNISFDDFMNISIIIPTIKEQQAIGSYFSNLDNLINSHREKISQLETLKKKLLQDMFI
ncbi:restriction endonuclease subunit S [Streptococcus pseudopneumoniae]|uniref:restriction endonuclease subunit S n=1 Tax=Streptococcus pseudopneumoniae TaxID=257758 RepID=UPI00066C06E4|nr:restriction endonuclease subunit S [Streptococcus pseudopneumoniae]